MNLSSKAKEAIKTALAMTIAYRIALSMDWDKPMWAGFAVAFISLATVGQSLNKGAMRMLGTLVAALVALTIIAWFPQQRWLFILTLSLYVGFCTYMMAGKKYSYFWFACGFVCVIIALEAGPDSSNAFMTALQRAEETGLGILVYSLVSILFWPSNSRKDFNSALQQLAGTQHQLYLACNDQMLGHGGAAEVQALQAQQIQQQTHFAQLLDAAESDSYEVWELRRQWRYYRRQVAELMETMACWRESFAEVQALDLQALLPNLSALHNELDQRMTEMINMLAGAAPVQTPRAIILDFDKVEMHRLAHFPKAALATTRYRLLQLEKQTRTLFNTVSDIKGFGPVQAIPAMSSARQIRFVPDPDRLVGVIRIIVSMWLAFLAMIYINDIPGGVGFVIMVSVVGMNLAVYPHMSVLLLFVPAAAAVLFAGVLYIFVMPGLSSFIGLGLMIFLTTFTICYLFSSPRQMLGRAFGLALFVIIISISNEQSYNFLSVANTALMFPGGFMFLLATAYFPINMRPEKVFLRQLERFFRSCEYLTATMQWDADDQTSYYSRWKKAFHHREIMTLPQKLVTWAPYIDTHFLPDTTPENVQDLVTSLQSLTLRMQELLVIREEPQAKFLVQELLADVRDWRLMVQNTFQRLATDPAVGNQEAFHGKLQQIMQYLESRIEATIDKAAEDELTAQDGENFYRLLGAYRGVSEALVSYAGSAEIINWSRWREERFA